MSQGESMEEIRGGNQPGIQGPEQEKIPKVQPEEQPEERPEQTPEEAFDPFSPELALKTCRENREVSERLIGEIREGLRNGEDQEELLLKATEAIGRMTNNTILKSLVEKALISRKTDAAD